MADQHSVATRRLAWFSPLPPSRSGIAAYSAEVIPILRQRGYDIDTYTESTARDFVWRRRREPYALNVFQLGNATCHDFMWGYLFRYPGLTVLHDAQLHQARALSLTRRAYPRADDYRAEFRANHPDAHADVAELVIAGLGDSVYHFWPMLRLVIQSARLTIVHNRPLLAQLREQYPLAQLESIDMGVADPRDHEEIPIQRSAEVRQRHRIPEDAIVVAAFGGITPEKRIPQLLEAVARIAADHGMLHVMLVGAEAAHYDVAADVRRLGLEDRVHLTGYVADHDLSAYLAVADICSCLRWPTNGETSASWLRCLAAAKPTIVTKLSQLADVVHLADPFAISIDVVDEGHTLPAALQRLVSDAALRKRLGEGSRRWWETHHQLQRMADDYERVIAAGAAAPTPRVVLPTHLTDDASGHVMALAQSIGVDNLLEDVFPQRIS